MLRGFLAVLAVFFTFQILDYVIHGLILMDSYEATAHLWRNPEDMNMTLMAVITLLVSIIIVCIYAKLVGKKSTGNGLLFGFSLGLLMGVSMGGYYCVAPISFCMTATWFVGTLVELTLAGLWVGLIVKEAGAAPVEAPKTESA